MSQENLSQSSKLEGLEGKVYNISNHERMTSEQMKEYENTLARLKPSTHPGCDVAGKCAILSSIAAANDEKSTIAA